MTRLLPSRFVLYSSRTAELLWRGMGVFLVLLALWIGPFAPPVHAHTRSAFVVGNNAYTHLATLANAVSDAAGLAAELRKSGFEVDHLSDAKADEINVGMARFFASVANGGVGVLYFSGHGAQIRGRN